MLRKVFLWAIPVLVIALIAVFAVTSRSQAASGPRDDDGALMAERAHGHVVLLGTTGQRSADSTPMSTIGPGSSPSADEQADLGSPSHPARTLHPVSATVTLISADEYLAQGETEEHRELIEGEIIVIELDQRLDDRNVFAPDVWWVSEEHRPEPRATHRVGPPDLPGFELAVAAVFEA